jgi:hypothetical protein
LEQLEVSKPIVDEAKGFSIRWVKNLPCQVGKAFFDDDMKLIRAKLETWFPKFGSLYDGAPSGDEVEAVTLWLVQRGSFRIIEILASIKLFKNKSNGWAIVHNLLDVIKGLQAWSSKMVCLCNGSSVNEWRINPWQYKKARIWTYRVAICLVHNLSKPGVSFRSNEAGKVRKHYNRVIVHKGKDNDIAKQELTNGKTLVVAGSVWFYNKWDQMDEMHNVDVEKIKDTFIDDCPQGKFPWNSVEKLAECTPAEKLIRSSVQFAVSSQFGCPFCCSTYSIESDNSVYLTAYIILEDMDVCVLEGVKMEGTGREGKGREDQNSVWASHCIDQEYQESCYFKGCATQSKGRYDILEHCIAHEWRV